MTHRLEFYRSRRGDEPALDYVRAQVKPHHAKIGRALAALEELGCLARRPLADYLQEGLYELRVAVEGHQHRLLYFFHGQESAFLKKDSAVPAEELARARRRREDWLERFGSHT